MFGFFFFKQKTAYEMRISDWSSDVCSSDLTVSTGEDRRPEHHPSLRKESAMKSLVLVAKSLLLSLLVAGSAFAADKVNINTADAATIDDVLLNVGPAMAQAIVDYRKANGAFRSAEQLAMVKGIGLQTIENNRKSKRLQSSH